MTTTEQIIEQVKAGTHRIESYATKRDTVFVLKRWREDLGIWNTVTAPSMCLRRASRKLVGRYIVSLGAMHYTAA